MAEATIAMAIQGGDFLALVGSDAGSATEATIGATPPGGAIAAAVVPATANGSGTTDGAGFVSPVSARSVDGSTGACSILSAVARREEIGTTLFLAAGGAGAMAVADGRGEARRAAAMPGLLGRIGRAGGGRLARGGGGAERRPDLAASRTMAASSGNDRTGRHSSSPSCQASESSVTAPRAAFLRISAMRMGPTGTPLTATYQSSLADSSDMSMGAEPSSSC
jgi:hypothetical protein